MKSKVKIAVVLAVVFVLGISFQTFAATAIKDITAKLRPDIKVIVNGEKMVSKDSKGQDLYPIIYNGITYLPAAPVANSLKTPYEYDAKTLTLYLGSKAKGPVRLTDVPFTNNSGAFPIKSTLDKNILTVETGDVVKDKVTYKYGLYADDITTYYNVADFKLNSKYKTLKFKAYCIKASDTYPIELIVTNTDTKAELYSKKFISGEDDDVNLNVSGVKNMKIQIKTDFSDTSKGQKFILLEPQLQ